MQRGGGIQTRIPGVGDKKQMPFAANFDRTDMSEGNVLFGFDHSALLVQLLRDTAPNADVQVGMAVVHFKFERLVERRILKTVFVSKFVRYFQVLPRSQSKSTGFAFVTYLTGFNKFGFSEINRIFLLFFY